MLDGPQSQDIRHEASELTVGAPASGHLAGAVQGLQPKLTIWTTGSGSEGGGDSMAPMRNLFTSLPPLVSPDSMHQVLGPCLSPLGGMAVS